MVFRLGLLELHQRPIHVVGVVHEICQIHARFHELRIELERVCERHDRLGVASDAVLRVANAGDRLRRILGVRHRVIEVGECRIGEALAKEGATDLQHQVDVVAESQRDGFLEGAKSGVDLPELEKHLAQPGERVFVFWIEYERFFEAASGPGILLPGQPSVAEADVELDSAGIQCHGFTQQGERFVVLALVVEGVSALVVFLGTQERGRHSLSDLRSERVTG